MIVYLYIPFILTTCLFLTLWIRKRINYDSLLEENKKIKEKLERETESLINLNQETQKYKKSLNLRKGYYKTSTNLITDKEKNTGDLYECIVYVTEVDRFKTGESKIILDDVEVIHGFNPDQYEWIKNGVKKRFSSIILTNSIHWLESENEIKQQRKEKLENILKKLNLNIKKS